MKIQRYSSILLIELEEECAQKFRQADLESNLARKFDACNACEIKENISQLWGVSMQIWKMQCLEDITYSADSLDRNTCLLACKKFISKV